MKILVTGALGYIGSHTCVELLNAGHEVIGVDNLSNSKIEVLEHIQTITGKTMQFIKTDCVVPVQEFGVTFTRAPIDGIIHFAAYKSVGDSVKEPLKYYQNNIDGLRNILALAKRKKTPIVFSSSACVYGDQYSGDLYETLALNPINPYGVTKVMGERLVEDCDVAYGIPSVSLRYFNPIGSHESGLLGDSTITNLMPFILKVAAKEEPTLKIFGNNYHTFDGTAIRDYVHVVDIAKAHIKALELISSGVSQTPINIGTGIGRSVLEVCRSFEKATGICIPYAFEPKRSGDAPYLVANNNRAKSVLKWTPELDLETMCSSAWNYKQQLK